MSLHEDMKVAGFWKWPENYEKVVRYYAARKISSRELSTLRDHFLDAKESDAASHIDEILRTVKQRPSRLRWLAIGAAALAAFGTGLFHKQNAPPISEPTKLSAPQVPGAVPQENAQPAEPQAFDYAGEYRELVQQYRQRRVDYSRLARLYLAVEGRQDLTRAMIDDVMRRWPLDPFDGLSHGDGPVEGLIRLKNMVLTAREGILYNRAHGRMLGYFRFGKVNCDSASYLTAFTYLMQGDDPNNLVFVYSPGHIQPGMLLDSVLIGVEATSLGVVPTPYGPLGQLDHLGIPLVVTRGVETIFARIARGIGNDQSASLFKRQALVHTTGTTSGGVGSRLSGALSDPFAFGDIRVERGDRTLGSGTEGTGLREAVGVNKTCREDYGVACEQLRQISRSLLPEERATIQEQLDLLKLLDPFIDRVDAITPRTDVTYGWMFEQLKQIVLEMNAFFENSEGTRVLDSALRVEDILKKYGLKVEIARIALDVYMSIFEKAKVMEGFAEYDPDRRVWSEIEEMERVLKEAGRLPKK